MKLLCPFCRDRIGSRGAAVQCVRCLTPLHEACWTEAGECTTRGCPSTEHAPLTRRATAKIVLGAGRRAVGAALRHARERISGISVVGLLMLSILTYGLVAAPVLATREVADTTWLWVFVGGLFAILTGWITALLYRGEHLHDDLEMKVADKNLGEYYPDFITDNAGCGCPDGGGCSGVDGEGAIVILGVLGIVVLAVVLLPLVAWIAIELVVPIVVLTIYGVLYGALATAINGVPELKGRLLPCALRGVFFGAVYTLIVAGVVTAGVLAKRAIDPPPPPPPSPIENKTEKTG